MSTVEILKANIEACYSDLKTVLHYCPVHLENYDIRLGYKSFEKEGMPEVRVRWNSWQKKVEVSMSSTTMTAESMLELSKVLMEISQNIQMIEHRLSTVEALRNQLLELSRA